MPLHTLANVHSLLGAVYHIAGIFRRVKFLQMQLRLYYINNLQVEFSRICGLALLHLLTGLFFVEGSQPQVIIPREKYLLYGISDLVFSLLPNPHPYPPFLYPLLDSG